MDIGDNTVALLAKLSGHNIIQTDVDVHCTHSKANDSQLQPNDNTHASAQGEDIRGHSLSSNSGGKLEVQ